MLTFDVTQAQALINPKHQTPHLEPETLSLKHRILNSSLALQFCPLTPGFNPGTMFTASSLFSQPGFREAAVPQTKPPRPQKLKTKKPLLGPPRHPLIETFSIMVLNSGYLGYNRG